MKTEPDSTGDAVDSDGVPLPPKQSKRGRRVGSKNKPKAADQPAAAVRSSSVADASGAVQPRKRGRPPGSKNKPKAGHSAPAATRGRGRGRGRAKVNSQPRRKYQRMYPSDESASEAASAKDDSEQQSDASISEFESDSPTEADDQIILASETDTDAWTTSDELSDEDQAAVEGDSDTLNSTPPLRHC